MRSAAAVVVTLTLVCLVQGQNQNNNNNNNNNPNNYNNQNGQYGARPPYVGPIQQMFNPPAVAIHGVLHNVVGMGRDVFQLPIAILTSFQNAMGGFFGAFTSPSYIPPDRNTDNSSAGWNTVYYTSANQNQNQNQNQMTRNNNNNNNRNNNYG